MSKHCEEYLDDPNQPECLRRFLDYQCRPAALKYPTGDAEFNRGLEERLGLPMWRDPVPTLFAIHERRQVRVTMPAGLGTSASPRTLPPSTATASASRSRT